MNESTTGTRTRRHSQLRLQITWYGQSAFRLVTPNGHVVLFDPWIVNPVNKSGRASRSTGPMDESLQPSMRLE